MVKQKNNQKKTGGSQDGSSPNSNSGGNGGGNNSGGGTSSSTGATTTTNTNTPRAPPSGPAPRHNQNGQPKRDRERQVGSQNSINTQQNTNTQKKVVNGTAEMQNGKPRENKEKNGYGGSQNSQSSSYGGYNSKNKNRDHSNSNSVTSQSKRTTNHHSSSSSSFPAGASSSSTSTASSKVVAQPELPKLEDSETTKSVVVEVPQEEKVTQTKVEKSSTPGALDMVAIFLEHGPWDRQELQCELLSLTNPIDLRLFANCIDGLASRNSLQLKPLETRANSPNPTAGFPSPYQVAIPSSYTEELSNGSSSSLNRSDSNKKKPRGSKSENSSEGPNDTKKTTPDSDDTQLNSESSTFSNGGDETANVLHTLYAMIALLNANNRKSAYHIAKYVEDYVLAARMHHLTKVTTVVEKIQLLELMGKIVSACLRHPAFSLNDKLKYIRCRDEIQCDLELKIREYQLEVTNNRTKRINLERSVGAVEENEFGMEKMGKEEISVLTGAAPVNGHLGSHSQYSPVLPSKSPIGTCVYIERFIGCQVDKQNPDSFQIEIQWSDRERTFTSRTREDLRVLHHRLLDEFGQERSENQRTTVSLQDDERSKSSSSSVNKNEASSSNPSRRILPFFMPEASSAEVVQYINELSDLPARIMLSRVISQEFNSTRNKTVEEDLDIDGIVLSKFRPPARSSEVNRQLIPSHNSHEAIYVNLHKPYVFGPVPEDHFQIVDKSCSNCGGDHDYVRCDKPTILEKKHDSVFHFDKKEVPLMPMPTSPNNAHFNYHQYEAEMGKMNEGNATPVQFTRNYPYDPSPSVYVPPQLNRPPPSTNHPYSNYGK